MTRRVCKVCGVPVVRRARTGRWPERCERDARYHRALKNAIYHERHYDRHRDPAHDKTCPDCGLFIGKRKGPGERCPDCSRAHRRVWENVYRRERAA